MTHNGAVSVEGVCLSNVPLGRRHTPGRQRMAVHSPRRPSEGAAEHRLAARENILKRRFEIPRVPGIRDVAAGTGV